MNVKYKCHFVVYVLYFILITVTFYFFVFVLLFVVAAYLSEQSEKPSSHNTQEALPNDDVHMRVHPNTEPTNVQQTEPQIVQNDYSHVIAKCDPEVPNTQTEELNTQDKCTDGKSLQRLSSDDGFEEDHLHLGFGEFIAQVSIACSFMAVVAWCY